MLHWTRHVLEGVSAAAVIQSGQKEAVKLLISASGSVWHGVLSVSAGQPENKRESGTVSSIVFVLVRLFQREFKYWR